MKKSICVAQPHRCFFETMEAYRPKIVQFAPKKRQKNENITYYAIK